MQILAEAAKETIYYSLLGDRFCQQIFYLPSKRTSAYERIVFKRDLSSFIIMVVKSVALTLRLV